MVDIRDLDVVDDEEVFRRRSAPDDQVVPPGLHLCDTRKDGNRPDDVLQPARQPADSSFDWVNVLTGTSGRFWK